MQFRSLIEMGLAVSLGLGASLSGWAQQTAELTTGDAAPAFSLVGSDGKTYSLADFSGKRAVVLAWFPKAFTGG